MRNILPAATILLLLAAAFPVAVRAQEIVVVAGRVEDAVTRQPIAGVRIFPVDSSTVVYSDSVGEFILPIPAHSPLALEADQIGYLAQRFDLSPDAVGKRSVLLLEPEPLVLSGVNVVADDAVTELLTELRRRRNFYDGSIQVLDRPALSRIMPVGSAWDLVRQRVPRLFECSEGLSGICLPGRTRTFEDPDPKIPVLVCVDGWRSFGAIGELENLPIQSVSMVELYSRGRGGIRVYTAPYLAHAARTNRFIATPLRFGC